MNISVPKLVHWLLAIFFRRIEVEGLENIPSEGGGLLVAWHPNGIIDPALILSAFPRKVVFGARHGLFRWPVLGWIMRSLGTIPLYRSSDIRPGSDPQEFRAANRKGLAALAQTIGNGSFSALFPEGLSHDESQPMPLRSGAARLYYQSVWLAPDDAPRPVIIPVGIHYDSKRLFRSLALVVFHSPLELPESLAEPREGDSAHREQVTELTGLLDQVLHEAVYATESWDLHHLMHRARSLLRAERAHRAGASPGPTDLKEKVLGFSRLWKAYGIRRRNQPEESARMLQRIVLYDEDLRALGLDDHHLDAPPRLVSPWFAIILFAQFVLVFLLLPPILLVGYLVNLPTGLLLGQLARWGAAKEKDEASIKILGGAVLFPLTWAVIAAIVAYSESRLDGFFPDIPSMPLLTATLVVAISALGGFVVLIYHPLARELRRAIRVRLTLHRSYEAVTTLLGERASLHDHLLAMSEGLDLPGQVARDGRIIALD